MMKNTYGLEHGRQVAHIGARYARPLKKGEKGHPVGNNGGTEDRSNLEQIRVRRRGESGGDRSIHKRTISGRQR